jgi:hypothetical protein
MSSSALSSVFMATGSGVGVSSSSSEDKNSGA